MANPPPQMRFPKLPRIIRLMYCTHLKLVMLRKSAAGIAILLWTWSQSLSFLCSELLALNEGHIPAEIRTVRLSGRVIIQKMPKLFAVTSARAVVSKLKKDDPKIPCLTFSTPWQFSQIRDGITDSYCSGWQKDHCHCCNDLHGPTVLLQRVAVSLIDSVERLNRSQFSRY